MSHAPISLFALDASRGFGERVAERLGRPLSRHEERGFEDGEHKARPLEAVRGRDAYVIQSLHGDASQGANDRLVRLLFFMATLKDAGAARVTALVPYLAYARKDRRTQPRDPVTTRYVARLFEAAGADCVVVLDVHNLAAFQNAFRCRTEHLEARRLFVEHFAARLAGRPLAVVSPDAGGMKRAEAFRGALARASGQEVATAFVEKYRAGGVVSGGAVVGALEGRAAVILDDLIAGGTTMARAARACREAGAREVWAAATHGLFLSGAAEGLADPALAGIVVTDSVPADGLGPGRAREKLQVLDVTGLFAEAVRRLNGDGSIVDLLAT